jgi:hypothetical protein
MDVAARLASVETALTDAYAELSTDLGDHHEQTSARLWRGQVLIDWEPDPQAGGCLLRPDLLQRLIALHAHVELNGEELRIVAPGRVVAALSREHAEIVDRLGGGRRVELRMALRFASEAYLGGKETYYVLERGQRVPLLRLTADVKTTPLGEGSPRTTPAPK